LVRDLREKLNIKICSDYWDWAYDKALKEPLVPCWLTEEYIRGLDNELGVLSENLETVILALKQITQAEELCVLAKTLYHLLGLRIKANELFSSFELPKAPKGCKNTLGYDCFSIFPILAHIRPSWKELEKRGVDKSILKKSFSFLDSFISATSEKTGLPVFREPLFLCYGAFIYIKTLYIDRLRFEICQHSPFPVRAFRNIAGNVKIMMDGVTVHKSGHILGAVGCEDEKNSFSADFKEKEEFYEGYGVDEKTHLVKRDKMKLPKKDWQIILSPGDAVIKVHIPTQGSFDKEACRQSYKKAREVFKRCFPEYSFKGFTTQTWLLAPELLPVLKDGSNIMSFRRDFHIFPAKSKGTSVFEYVYHIKVNSVDEVDISKLDESNSLMRGIKTQCLRGEYIHEFSGFIPI